MSDSHNLERFVTAQENVYAAVVEELGVGRKRSHWMWFIFPQAAGLGMSATSRKFAIQSLDEARAYLAHPLLGARLRQCTQLVMNVEGRTAEEIFGSIDSVKLRSCLTLFDAASDEQLFRDAIEKYYCGETDQRTLQILSSDDQ